MFAKWESRTSSVPLVDHHYCLYFLDLFLPLEVTEIMLDEGSECFPFVSFFLKGRSVVEWMNFLRASLRRVNTRELFSLYAAPDNVDRDVISSKKEV